MYRTCPSTGKLRCREHTDSTRTIFRHDMACTRQRIERGSSHLDALLRLLDIHEPTMPENGGHRREPKRARAQWTEHCSARSGQPNGPEARLKRRRHAVASLTARRTCAFVRRRVHGYSLENTRLVEGSSRPMLDEVGQARRARLQVAQGTACRGVGCACPTILAAAHPPEQNGSTGEADWPYD